MNIENLFLKKVSLDKNFSCMALYNNSRGAVYKNEYKSFIKKAIEKEVITVEKFIVAENIQEELYQISETKGFQYTLIEHLKEYPNEPNYLIAPLIYLMRKLDPQFTLDASEGKLQIVSKVVNIEVSPRIDGENATPRFFLPKEKIAITSTNINIENLGDILAVKNITVYTIGTENHSNTICAHKINRDDRFFEAFEEFKNRLIDDLML